MNKLSRSLRFPARRSHGRAVVMSRVENGTWNGLR
jgi:hypothetical protein